MRDKSTFVGFRAERQEDKSRRSVFGLVPTYDERGTVAARDFGIYPRIHILIIDGLP